MSIAIRKNLHVPLPAEIHRKLRAESVRRKQPATLLVREAVVQWLEQQQRATLHQELAAYAARNAGTAADLDPNLEEAAIEQLLAPKGRRR